MLRSQRLLLKISAAQEDQFRGSAGLSRFAWNWAVNLCGRHYELFGDMPGYKRLSAFTLKKYWNKVKNRHFPWVAKYSKFIPEDTFRKLDQAYMAAFVRLKAGKSPGFPRFHKKGIHESFCVTTGGSNRALRRVGRRFNIPRIGFVRSQSPLRWPNGKIKYGRAKLKAGRWWLTIAYDLEEPKKLTPSRPVCGVDLGVSTFATIVGDGQFIESVPAPKPYAKAKRRLRRLQRSFDRKAKGSANRNHAKRKLGRAHEKAANIRNDFLHQLSSRLIKQFAAIGIETLDVQAMSRGYLSCCAVDLGWAEFRRQLTYKAEALGTAIVLADRLFPSSKLCSACGEKLVRLRLDEREWKCRCGTKHNRDINAATNLSKLAWDTRKVTPAETGGSGGSLRRDRPVPVEEAGMP